MKGKKNPKMNIIRKEKQKTTKSIYKHRQNLSSYSSSFTFQIIKKSEFETIEKKSLGREKKKSGRNFTDFLSVLPRKSLKQKKRGKRRERKNFQFSSYPLFLLSFTLGVVGCLREEEEPVWEDRRV